MYAQQPTRRQMLKASTLLLAGCGVSGCGGQTPEAEPNSLSVSGWDSALPAEQGPGPRSGTALPTTVTQRLACCSAAFPGTRKSRIRTPGSIGATTGIGCQA